MARAKPYFWIALAAFIVYCQTLFFGFTYYDDNILIVEKPSSQIDIANIFLSNAFYNSNDIGFYRPLMNLSFMADGLIGGNNPFIYHATSLAFHIFACWALYLLLITLGYRKDLSFVFTLIFSVHPALSQAVAWIPGRNDPMLALFALLSFVFLIRFLNNGKLLNIFLHLLMMVLALFSKETAVIFFPIMFLYFGFLLKNELSIQKLTALISGWFVMLYIWFSFREIALISSGRLSFSDAVNSVTGNINALFIYIGKIFFPFNLSVLPTMQDSSVIAGLICTYIVFCFIYFSRNKNTGRVMLGFGWFIFLLIPAITANREFLEHRLYLPMVGMVILLFEVDFIKNLDLNNKTVKLCLGMLLILLSLITISHSLSFKDRVQFWTNAVNTSPNYAKARRNFGAVLYYENRYDEAEYQLKYCISINPSEKGVYNSLGNVYAAKGKMNEAIDSYKKELEYNSSSLHALTNLSTAYMASNEHKKAIPLLLKMISVMPGKADTYKLLAECYAKTGDKTNAGRLLKTYNSFIK